MKKTIKMHEERSNKQRDDDAVPAGAVPAYLLDREGQSRAKVLSNMVKQKRKEKAGKWNVPLPKVRGMGEDEVFRVIKTGKRKGERLFCSLASVLRCASVLVQHRVTPQPRHGSAWSPRSLLWGMASRGSRRSSSALSGRWHSDSRRLT
eukprot:Opistho-1_new@108120